MSSLPTYLRKTLVGGILVALPVVLFVNVVIWIGGWFGDQVSPAAVVLADALDAPLWLGKTLSILGVLALCFALGVFVGNRFGHRIFLWFESRTVGRLPGYRAIKEVVEYFGKNDRNLVWRTEFRQLGAKRFHLPGSSGKLKDGGISEVARMPVA